jgi:hypothetical protein
MGIQNLNQTVAVLVTRGINREFVKMKNCFVNEGNGLLLDDQKQSSVKVRDNLCRYPKLGSGGVKEQGRGYTHILHNKWLL